MKSTNHFEVIIVGGSYSGLSAAMALGRALRKVLIIDSGKPCNAPTPYSHNFITQDGKKPAEIAREAKEQVLQYDTITFYEGLAIEGQKTEAGFQITTQSKEVFTAQKLIFATGISDIMPDLEGFADCWGISILHCPYCHGYEVKNEKTALLSNGEMGFQFGKMISHWTDDLTLLTNGASTLTSGQKAALEAKNIKIEEKPIQKFIHENGYVQQVIFEDGTTLTIKAVYAHPEFRQHCDIPVKLGCELTEEGLVKVDSMQKSSVDGIWVCGDAAAMRSVATAVYTGSVAGAILNKALIEEMFTEEALA